MTAFRAGLVYLRADDDANAERWPRPRRLRRGEPADPYAIDGEALAVLAAMASFCRDDAPVCTASQATIARRARFSEDVVGNRVRRLERAGLIINAGGGKAEGCAVRWRLVGLDGTADDHQGGTAGSGTPSAGVPLGAEPPTAGSGTGYRHELDDPSDSSRPPGREGGGSPAPAPLAPSADAAGAAARAAGPSAALLAELAAEHGRDVEHVRAWAAAMLDGRTITTSADQYLRGCVRRGYGPATWTPPASRPAPRTRTSTRTSTGEKGSTTRAGRGGAAQKKKGKGQPSARELEGRRKQADAVRGRKHGIGDPAAVLRRYRDGGESPESIADDLMKFRGTIRDWCHGQDKRDSMAAARAGEPPEQVAEQYRNGWDVGFLREEARRAALDEISGGRSHAQVAEKFGQDLDVVGRWHVEAWEKEQERRSRGAKIPRPLPAPPSHPADVAEPRFSWEPEATAPEPPPRPASAPPAPVRDPRPFDPPARDPHPFGPPGGPLPSSSPAA